MNFQEITKLNREVRVVGSTYAPTTEKDGMIGKEYEIDDISFRDNIVVIDIFYFYLSDVAFLTPLSFKGKRIAIGDEIQTFANKMWRKVYAYHWFDGEVLLNVVGNDYLENGCYDVSLENITAHRIPSSTPDTLVSGTEFEFTKDGKVYKAVIK